MRLLQPRRWVLALAVLSQAGCFPYEPLTEKGRIEGYVYEFGSPPAPGVKVLKARLAGVRDSEQNWLKIAMKEDPTRFLLSRGFKKLEKESEIWPALRKIGPGWWRPVPAGDFEYFECKAWPELKGLQWAEAYVAVSQTDELVYFVCKRGG